MIPAHSSQYTGPVQIASTLLMHIALINLSSLTSVCGRLLSILTLKGCKEVLGSPGKSQMNGHKIAVHFLQALSIAALTAEASSSLSWRDVVLGLLQRMLLLGVDTADMRSTVVSSLVSLLTALHNLNESSTNLNFFPFVTTLSAAKNSNHRLICTELALHLLTTGWIWEEPYFSTTFLYLLITRCNDTLAAVRLRAISALYSLYASLELPSTPSQMKVMLRQCVDAPVMPTRKSLHNRAQHQMTSRSELEDEEEEGEEDKEDELFLLDALFGCASDERPLVKAKAIATLELLHTNQVLLCSVDDDLLLLLVEACADQSLSVRRQALGTLTSLLLCYQQYREDAHATCAIVEAFVQYCLPMIYDAVIPSSYPLHATVDT